jgi:hypothetical protein
MNTNATIEYFLTLFDEFSKIAPPKILAYLNIAIGRAPLTIWTTNAQYAQSLLTAHMLTASGRQGAGSSGGPTTAEQVGDLSRSYQYIGEVGSGDAWLATTRYGIDFIELRNSTIVPMMSTRSPILPGPCGPY